MSAYQNLTERAQLNEQYGQTGVVLWGNFVIGMITSFFYANLINNWFLIFWLTTLTLILLIRFGVYKAYKNRDITASDSVKNWLIAYATGTFATGLCWSVLAISLTLSLSGQDLFIIFLALVGLTGGNIATSSYRKRLFYCYSVPILLPPGVVALFSGDSVTMTMGIFSLTLFAYTLIAVKRLNHSLGKAIYLDFQNRALIDELEKEKQRLERTNQKLNQELQQKLSMTKWLATAAEKYEATRQLDVSNGNFSEILEDIWELAIEHQQPLSMVIFQIDGEKTQWPKSDEQLNDQLYELQSEICSEIRTDDHFIRINDEEFAVILSQMSANDAVSLVNRLRQKLAYSPALSSNNGQQTLTISFGVAGWVPNITQSSDELVVASRRAKNLSIERGGNQVNIG